MAKIYLRARLKTLQLAYLYTCPGHVPLAGEVQCAPRQARGCLIHGFKTVVEGTL